MSLSLSCRGCMVRFMVPPVRAHASITPIVIPAVLDSMHICSAYMRPTLVFAASRMYPIASSRAVRAFHRSSLTVYPA
ncbi:uncharacterized protein HD556DRAFT_1385076 [Suillus plorans]|uniref:Uncharacterized protein n=1 Tax=Suillus plorans TaxID=116603 RepID=A0A9P7AL77_9AGAM|nr:uncharacterized protein HD556DRAFT_1416224 [Suillus plorans]XP_041158348.1 uncharacterized protein HD556DRAFT_1385076 [Suillus plorans]KAG1786313.1 hypothetical protein HD556DRAFT_1416224 [Suillus plorans]KAG1791542.1 hypothetical protein HD556DRAFT_1385076 [Suillus plorans]